VVQNTTSTAVTAAILVIGDEILSGRTKDQNIGYIADHLAAIGIDLNEVRIVADDEADIVAAVNALRHRYTYVFTTGGIGPTHDDITVDCIAKAFGVPVVVDPKAHKLLADYFNSRGLELTEARMRMARVPEGAKLIDNAMSIAPGAMIANVIVMAGVPKIMQVMLDAVTPLLKTGSKMLSVTIPLDRPEGDIAELFAAQQALYPEVRMGSYPNFAQGRFSTQLVLRAKDEALLNAATASLRAILQDRGYL
jgi:molybdenum cofactor synthesis domain-containing protein